MNDMNLNPPVPSRTRIKICGLTCAEDVDVCLGAGADALGFVFYPPSPRYVGMARAEALMRRVPAFVAKVGLFVNMPAEEVRAHLDALPIDLLQFHGDEAPEYCARFQRPWMKAARMAPGVELLEFATQWASAEGIRGVLADSFCDHFGGSGVTFDWARIPQGLPLPLILSGGLNPDNVGAAIRAARPWAVDVSSGVEGPEKGRKDRAKIESFMRGVRNADAERAV